MRPYGKKEKKTINVREETEVKVFIKHFNLIQVNQVKGLKSGERKAPSCDKLMRK
jgi:hypothetical protein